VQTRLRIRAYNSSRPISAWQATVAGTTFPPGDPDGYDATWTIDRVVPISTTAGTGFVQTRVTLRGDCFGVAADVATGMTCVDAPNQLVAAPNATIMASSSIAPSVVGTWPAAQPIACATTPHAETGLFDEELCVPGGAYVMGAAADDNSIPNAGNLLEFPERVVQVSPFVIERYEVSVGRFRAAMNDPVNPFVPPSEPTQPDAPIDCGAEFNHRFCTWRGAEASPDPAADALPVNCIDSLTAQAFCQWEGGDLPSEAQWEYAATQAFRQVKSVYPWVGAAISCDIAAYGRWSVEEDTGECGLDVVCGPLPVNVPFGAGEPTHDCVGVACVRDETPGPDGGGGLIGMGGNVSEWVRDLDVSFDAPCWQNAARLDPVCDSVPGVTTNMFRGGTWAIAALFVASELRTGGIVENPELAEYGGVGFRCMRPGTVSP
jgi:formylglycine-generating enzyme required for sulfatase activity